jgi:hypothetical protein
LTGDLNNNIFVELFPINTDYWYKIRRSDENGYIVKIEDKIYDVVVRDRFNW